MFEGALPPQNDDDDDEELTPPEAMAVAGRILAHCAIQQRGMWETQPPDPAVTAAWWAWVRETVWPYATARERTRLAKPRGALSEQEQIDCSWTHENLTMLGWALGIEPAPEIDAELPLATLYPEITFGVTPERLIQGRQLRSPEEIEGAACQYESVYWRVRTERIAREERETIYGPYARLLMRRACHLGLLPPDRLAPNGELVLLGRPVPELSEDDLSQLGSIVSERLRTLNWLCGFESDWDYVTGDTAVVFLQGDDWPPELQNTP